MQDSGSAPNTRVERTKAALRECLKFSGNVALDLLALFLIVFPAAFKIACIGAAVAGALWSGYTTFIAFGGDPFALLPAGAVAILPVAYFTKDTKTDTALLAALLFSSVVSVGLGYIVAIGPLPRVVIVLLALAVSIQFQKQKEHKGEDNGHYPNA